MLNAKLKCWWMLNFLFIKEYWKNISVSTKILNVTTVIFLLFSSIFYKKLFLNDLNIDCWTRLLQIKFCHYRNIVNYILKGSLDANFPQVDMIL